MNKSSVIEKILKRLIESLITIIIFLMILAFYNCYFSKNSSYTNNYEYVFKDEEKKLVVEDKIDKFSKLQPKSKYSSLDIEKITEYFKSNYNILVLYSKENNCDLCNKKDLFNAVLNHKKIYDENIINFNVSDNIHNEDIEKKLNRFSLYIKYDSDIFYLNIGSILDFNVKENISFSSAVNIYDDFIDLLDDLYEEVNSYE